MWLTVLAVVLGILLVPASHKIFMQFTTKHAYMGGFIKFLILASMGELLAIRIASGDWRIPCGIIYRAVIWGFLGIVITLMFNIFASGVKGALASGFLPGGESNFAFAFFVSTIMNLTFAPTFMAFHRITDTYIDLKYQKINCAITMKDIVSRIDWNNFISFVVLKTIPFFWIPAHTVTFLVAPEYRVLVAAFLSMALGGILAFAKKQKQSA